MQLNYQRSLVYSLLYGRKQVLCSILYCMTLHVPNSCLTMEALIPNECSTYVICADGTLKRITLERQHPEDLYVCQSLISHQLP